MKATQKDFVAVAPRAVRACSVFFLCGPDEAGVADAADRIVAMLDNAGERIDLSGSELKRDPVRLGDEARSTSLFGDSRYIIVRANGDEAADALEILLGAEVECCPVIVLASGATDKSRCAKLLASRPDALSAMFYPPDQRAVVGAVRAMADTLGIRLADDLAERIARGASLDTRLAKSELIKLALYLDADPQAPRTADAAALDAIGAPSEEDGFMSLVNVVLGGEAGKLSGELRRMREMSLNPVGLLLAFERRAAQLAQLAARLGPSGDIAGLIESEIGARRVFFRDKRDLVIQVRRWRGRRLERLVAKLVGLHRALLANSQSAELLLAQGLTEIARAAR